MNFGSTFSKVPASTFSEGRGLGLGPNPDSGSLYKVCYQLVKKLIVELKKENPFKFKLFLPLLGTFYTQMSFSSAFYKLTRGSRLS